MPSACCLLPSALMHSVCHSATRECHHHLYQRGSPVAMVSCVEVAQQYSTQLHGDKVLKAEKGEISVLGEDLWCADWWWFFWLVGFFVVLEKI